LPPRAADATLLPHHGPTPALATVHRAIVACERCPRLRRYCQRIAIEKRAAFRDQIYWGRPVPGFGDPAARLLVVGLAPAAHGANRTGRVFTGDGVGGSSDFLLTAMHASGFATRDLEVLRGVEGADRMDGTGAVAGWLGRLRRAFDFTLMDQLVDFAAYERALRDGRAVVMVHVHGDAPKAAAHDVLKRHAGHFINYYGRFATEELDLWLGPEPDVPGYLRR
jgi:hypothetical protein